MIASVYTALFISVLFSVEFFILSAKAVERLEESKVPQNAFNPGTLTSIGQPEKPRSSGSFKPYYLLQPGKDLGFRLDPKTIPHPFTSASQRLFKLPLNLHEPMKEPLYFSAKRADASEASNQVEQIDTTDALGVTTDGENGAIFPMGRRDFDMLRCMLGRVYRPCWQN
ncbi:pro-MCH [Heterodontus francisci]|uniref:pro-MCH n=1 Tax=Heterodontus francisci TaxID=7792 RepID=UPI00355B8529